MKKPFQFSMALLKPSGFGTPLKFILATTAAMWMGSAAAQLAPVSVRQGQELRFRDFFSMPIGPEGLQLSDRLRQADGQTVRLVGYMVQQERNQAGSFLLSPRPVQMTEYANDLPASTVLVQLDATQSDWVVPHVRGLVEISGRLQVGRHEGKDGRISWVRLDLAEEAARGMNAYELAGYLHAAPVRTPQDR
jgi:hypothetical protein